MRQEVKKRIQYTTKYLNIRNLYTSLHQILPGW